MVAPSAHTALSAQTAPSAQPEPRLIDGPAAAPATLLLAHGAGAPMDRPFMLAIATGLADKGWRVVRFEFPYMARARLTGRRGGLDRLPVLLECFRDQLNLEGGERPLFPGGKSLGGRVASLLLDALSRGGSAAEEDLGETVRGGICLGYPFHPPGKPERLRTEHLQTLRTPTLILQGERDPFGRPEEVAGYALSPQLQLQWIPHGDHSFKPSRSSGLTEAGNWALAVEHVDRFCRERLGG